MLASCHTQIKQRCLLSCVVRGHHIYKSIWTPVLGENDQAIKRIRAFNKDQAFILLN